MRLDKFLKVSRLIRRRTVAKAFCDAQRVRVNGRPVKASYEVMLGDHLAIQFSQGERSVVVIALKEHVPADQAVDLYRDEAGIATNGEHA